jgi:hypothetical protein
MSEPPDSDRDRAAFAVERSHRDAESSNSTSRATAQASILINGGAATAVLAFVAKEMVERSVMLTASLCLIGYAIGVVAGACMMYCNFRSLDYYGLRWRLEAHPEEGSSVQNNKELGQRWWTRSRQCFYVSMTAFILSSIILAGALLISAWTAKSTMTTTDLWTVMPDKRAYGR